MAVYGVGARRLAGQRGRGVCSLWWLQANNLELYRLCTFQILIENQVVQRLAEKDYSAGVESYWYQYFKRVCSMKEMIIHQKWYKMVPDVMHMKHNRVCSTKEMIIHQKWYLM
ncbi:hypothetical protein Pcinc_010868 [Petrolisthes cinctipes]|uniref:Uncharacterized protein n=1 Tax=Petrolisthes cinctipes TaxID=88211 RepID=A0AAE1G242_PETCI|nr:hypothetical protein Pcinc_010868 [Petrolisthes cinctipes]